MCLGQGAFLIQIIAVGFREDSLVSASALITVVFEICSIIIAAGPACLLTLNFFFSSISLQERPECPLSSKLLEPPLKPGEAGEQGSYHPE